MWGERVIIIAIDSKMKYEGHCTNLATGDDRNNAQQMDNQSTCYIGYKHKPCNKEMKQSLNI